MYFHLVSRLSNQKKKENSKIQQRFLMEKIILQYIYIYIVQASFNEANETI